ncbi:MAG: hypothetical protein R6X02_03110 [Enhygromyxa sp.]
MAHYDVLSDASFTLMQGEQHRVLFNPENDAYLEDTARRATILTYMVDPSNDASGIEIEVFARMGGRDKRISVLRVSGTQLRTVLEPFNPSGLQTGDNRITFKVSSGSGSVRISNVIMWYQRRLAAVR